MSGRWRLELDLSQRARKGDAALRPLSFSGVMLSQPLNIEPAGPIASMAGLGFLLIVLIVLFAPAQGLLAQWQIRRCQRRKLMAMLAQSAAEKSVLDRGLKT